MVKMSTRLLRKLCKSDLLSDIGIDVQISSEDEAPRPVYGPSVFSLLQSCDSSEKDSETSESDEEVKKARALAEAKRKKRAARRKRRPLDEDLVALDLSGPNRKKEEFTEEKEVPEPPVVKRKEKPLFYVEYKYLNPQKDLEKRQFSLMTFEERAKARRQRFDFKLRGALVQPKREWKLSKMAIQMVETKETEGQDFKFIWNDAYKQKNEAVRAFLPENSTDVDGLFRLFLDDEPYLMDALLHYSECLLVLQEVVTATDQVKAALYYLQSAMHPLFNFPKGHCRMDYNIPENRCMFLFIFKYIECLEKTHCYRTALEFCKVLMSLDSVHDPLATMLLIDHYALLTREFTYLIRLFEELESEKHLSLLCNFSYSVALAYSLKGDQEKAESYLMKAMIGFPGVVIQMLNKNSSVVDPQVASHSFFSNNMGCSSIEKMFCALYVQRTASVWAPRGTVVWLNETALKVISLVNDCDPEVVRIRSLKSPAYEVSEPPLNVIRHVMLSRYSEAIQYLPTEYQRHTLQQYDPVPPKSEDSSKKNTSRTGLHYLGFLFSSLLPNQDVVTQLNNS